MDKIEHAQDIMAGVCEKCKSPNPSIVAGERVSWDGFTDFELNAKRNICRDCVKDIRQDSNIDDRSAYVVTELIKQEYVVIVPVMERE